MLAIIKMSIGNKLNIGISILVVLTLMVIGAGFLGIIPATQNIRHTKDVRFPTALAASQAQANLLRMLGDVRGYLALGKGEFRTSFTQSRQAFETDLAELERLSPLLNQENRDRLNELKATFAEWSELPDELFALRDDQLEREPAYRILATDGILLGGRALIDINEMIETQGRRESTPKNIALLADMAKFQGTFAAMLSGLRGYVTTRNHIFRGEYEANLAANEFAWDRLNDQRDNLTSSQQEILDNIVQNREEFLLLPDQIFEILESDRWREDLYLFSAEAVPLTEKMQQLLAEMTTNQQTSLQTDLREGARGLSITQWQTVITGLVALLVGLSLALMLRGNIVGPVQRLTEIAERIRGGDLAAQARVESDDEIGTLAETFNSMTGQLRQTLEDLEQRQCELQQAHNLLEQRVEKRTLALSEANEELKKYRHHLEELVMQRTVELEEKNRALEETLQQLTETQNQLIVQEKLASLGALTAGIAHEIKNPLNFVNNFAALSIELGQELGEVIETQKDRLDAGSLQEITGILSDLAFNAAKINEEGKRADSIVRGMLLHSRGQSGQPQPVDLNVLLSEAVTLAYPSMLAGNTALDITVETVYDPTLEPVAVVPQEIIRVFLNVINNAYSALHQKKTELGDDFSPSLAISTKNLDNQIEIGIRDNGPGIAPEMRDKIFDPFFTTRSAGEGTGLGLSISYDIIVHGHQGEIEVDTVEGQYTKLIIHLPKQGVGSRQQGENSPTRSIDIRS